MDRIWKLLIILLLLYLATLFFMIFKADGTQEKVQTLFIGGLALGPSYIFAVLLTILLSLNNITNKRAFIYPLVLILSGFILIALYAAINYNGYQSNYYYEIFALPFFIIPLITIYYWYQEWKENW